MARIKCRYSIAYCNNALWCQDKYDDEVKHDEFWFCDSSNNCDYYKKPENAKVINPTCIYCKFRHGEFEKTVKTYEYYDGTLTVAGREYTSFEIDYLEIDGRVLVDDKEG